MFHCLCQKTLKLACIHTSVKWFGSSLVWWGTIELYILVLVCLDLDSRSQGYEKANNFVPVISQSSQFCLCNLVICGELLVWWISFSFYLIWSLLEGENPACVISLKRTMKKTTFSVVGMHSNFYWLISFKLDLMIEATKLHILTQFGWPWPLFKLAFVWEIQEIKEENFSTHLLWNSSVNFDEMNCAATTYWFVECHAKLFLHKLYSRKRTLLMWFYEIHL